MIHLLTKRKMLICGVRKRLRDKKSVKGLANSLNLSKFASETMYASCREVE